MAPVYSYESMWSVGEKKKKKKVFIEEYKEDLLFMLHAFTVSLSSASYPFCTLRGKVSHL